MTTTKMGIIYKATNTVTGKVYIGQTIRTLEKRIRGHRTLAFRKEKPKFKFHKAIRKYGLEAFIWEVVLTCLVEELNDKETTCIKENDSYRNGYNMTEGGGAKYLSITSEVRQKMEAGRKGRKPSKETRQKMSECRRGDKNHFYGRHHTEGTRQKLREMNIGKLLSDETKRKIGLSSAGHTLSLETRERMSKERLGKPRPKESIEKASRTKRETGVMAGENNPNFGKKHSEDTKAKMKVAWAKRRLKKNGELKHYTQDVVLDSEDITKLP
jgi:group I intron endonuclease